MNKFYFHLVLNIYTFTIVYDLRQFSDNRYQLLTSKCNNFLYTANVHHMAGMLRSTTLCDSWRQYVLAPFIHATVVYRKRRRNMFTLFKWWSQHCLTITSERGYPLGCLPSDFSFSCWSFRISLIVLARKLNFFYNFANIIISFDFSSLINSIWSSLLNSDACELIKSSMYFLLKSSKLSPPTCMPIRRFLDFQYLPEGQSELTSSLSPNFVHELLNISFPHEKDRIVSFSFTNVEYKDISFIIANN